MPPEYASQPLRLRSDQIGPGYGILTPRPRRPGRRNPLRRHHPGPRLHPHGTQRPGSCRRRRQHQPRGRHVFLHIGGLPGLSGHDFIHDPQRHPLRTGPVASMLLMAAALSAARSWSLGGAAGSPEEGQQAQVPATGGRLLGTATPTPPPARERAEHPDLHCQRLDRNTAAVRAYRRFYARPLTRGGHTQ
jgi:hypothetical protein